ncbi:MAG: transglycosylase SLT domain-containing protein [Halothiobacillaceae bacterium]
MNIFNTLQRVFRLMLLFGALGFVAPLSAGLEEERAAFASAYPRVQGGQALDAESLAALKSYPLLPYLTYLDLRERLPLAETAEVAAFVQAYPLSFMTDDLRRRYLRQLAKNADWAAYLALDDSSLSTQEFRCQRLVAQGSVQGSASVIEAGLALWDEGASWPPVCQPLESWLMNAEKMSDELIWWRIERLMEKNLSSEAARLAAHLGSDAQAQVVRWQGARKNPAAFMAQNKAVKGDIVLHLMLADSAKQVAKKDVDEAYALWNALAARDAMSAKVRGEAEGGIALVAARQHHAYASDWFEAAPSVGFDADMRAWRVRAALRQQSWARVLKAIDAMPLDEQKNEEWRYWRARALEQQGQGDLAKQIWQEVAAGVSYYGLLSADRAGVDYRLAYVELPDDARVNTVAQRPAVQRAREFYAQGMIAEARKEWQVALRDMDLTEQHAAAHLAARWGWVDRAAITMGKARNAGMEDLEVRFPLPWREDVERFARDESIESGWMFGIMRRESVFMSDIGSSAGAQGLMQLMPGTAKDVARKLAMPAPSKSDLHDPATNMRLGSAYLADVLGRFDGNQVLATAAYNAGPGRVNRWLPKDESLPADIWVDTVPFTETRDYCRAVLHYATVFDWRLHGETKPMSARMPAVSGR